MNPELRDAFINALIPRVVENAPLRELIRVYSEAVNSAVRPLDDDALLASTIQAGYSDLLDLYGIPQPDEAPAEEPVAEDKPKKKTTRKKTAVA